MGVIPEGQGRSSHQWRKTHTYHKGGLYWRSEQDYRDARDESNKKRRDATVEMRLTVPPKSRGPKNPWRKGKGVSSRVETPDHKVYGHKRWWRTEEDYKLFRDKQVLMKRADRNEVSVERQMQIERDTSRAIYSAKAQEERLKQEFTRLRAKHGLRKNATRAELKTVYAKTLDPEIKQFFHMDSVALMKSDEKIHEIRELFLTGVPPKEILYRTALMVGVKLGSNQ